MEIRKIEISQGVAEHLGELGFMVQVSIAKYRRAIFSDMATSYQKSVHEESFRDFERGIHTYGYYSIPESDNEIIIIGYPVCERKDLWDLMVILNKR